MVLLLGAARDHSVQSKKRKSEAGASEDLGSIRKSSSRAKPGPAEDVAMVAPSDARSSIEKSTPAARATPATPGTPITPTEGSSEARRYIRSAAKVQKVRPLSMLSSYSGVINTVQCRVRDSNLCLLTETWNCTEVAHIYPFSLGTKAGSDEHEEFWERLSYFWSTERIERWQKAIFGNEGTEILENLMCLAPTVHALWGTCRFAIKPINLSDDKKVLKVQFFWLSVGKYTPRNPQAPPTAPTNTFSSAEGTGLIHKLSTQAPQLIRSGDMMIFRTDDPENFPLPSIELLDMQWALHRATALSGAAEVTDEDFDADDGLGLAPPISVDEGAAMILSKLEREEGDDEYEEENEEEDDKGQAAQEEFAVESTTTAAVPRAGENVPLATNKGKQRQESAEPSPLGLRARDPNVS